MLYRKGHWCLERELVVVDGSNYTPRKKKPCIMAVGVDDSASSLMHVRIGTGDFCPWVWGGE